MSREVKVAMTGPGGDELFGNYGKFREYEKNRNGHLWAYERGWVGVTLLGIVIMQCVVTFLTRKSENIWDLRTTIKPRIY